MDIQVLVKRKTFEFEDDLAAQFEEFCRSRRLVEKGVVEAMAAYFMMIEPSERERVFRVHDEWKAARPAGRISENQHAKAAKPAPPKISSSKLKAD